MKNITSFIVCVLHTGSKCLVYLSTPDEVVKLDCSDLKQAEVVANERKIDMLVFSEHGVLMRRKPYFDASEASITRFRDVRVGDRLCKIVARDLNGVEYVRFALERWHPVRIPIWDAFDCRPCDVRHVVIEYSITPKMYEILTATETVYEPEMRRHVVR